MQSFLQKRSILRQKCMLFDSSNITLQKPHHSCYATMRFFLIIQFFSNELHSLSITYF